MFGLCPRTNLHSLILLISVIVQSQGFLKDETTEPSKYFQLSSTPSHVVKHVTKDVKVRCSQGGGQHPEFQGLDGIQLMRRSPGASGWQLLAEQSAVTGQPTTARDDLTVSGRIGDGGVDAFLEVTWPLAVEDTFGTYRCHVKGTRRDAVKIATVVTPQIDITNEDVNVWDMFSLFGRINDELSCFQETMFQLNENISYLNENHISLEKEFERHSEEVARLNRQTELVDGSVDNLKKEMTATKVAVSSLALSVDLISNILSTETGKVTALERKVPLVTEDLDLERARADKASGDVTALEGETKSLDEELQSVNREADALAQSVSSTARKFDAVRVESESATEDLRSFKGDVNPMIKTSKRYPKELQTVKDQMSGLTKDMNHMSSSLEVVDELLSWPEGQFALLRPATGCPVDLSFFGQGHTYLQIHTESTSPSNGNRHSEILGKWTISEEDSKHFFTLWFCEANGIFNSKPWPQGSYCINQISDAYCPYGFREGDVRFDIENDDPVMDHTSTSVRHALGIYLDFCCRNDGVHTTAVVLPTLSQFLLYRIGGQCQKVEGMAETEETMAIDTEDSSHIDGTSGLAPDIEIYETEPIVIHLCHYTKV